MKTKAFYKYNKHSALFSPYKDYAALALEVINLECM